MNNKQLEGKENCCSKCPMNCAKGKCCFGISFNILSLYIWYTEMSLFSFALYLLIGCMCKKIIMNQLKGNNVEKEKESECCSKEKMQSCIQCTLEKIKGFKAYLDSVASLKDTSDTVEFFVDAMIIHWIAGRFSFAFLLWIVVNLAIFHEPINKRYPHFLFYSYLYVKQMIEGIIGLIECLVPRYEEIEAEAK